MHKFDIKNIEKLDNPERRKELPPGVILNCFPLKEKDVLLDIGCGIGYFSIPGAMILKEGKVIAVDILQEILDIAKERAGDLQNIDFRLCKEYELPLKDKEADKVLISNVIHEIECKEVYLKEVKRVMKDQGQLLIIDWEKIESHKGPKIQDKVSKECVIDICKEQGFQYIEEFKVNEYQYILKFELL